MAEGARQNFAAILAVLLALTSAVMLVLAGPLYRREIVGLTTAFGVMRWAAYAAIAAVLLAVVAAILAARWHTGKGMAVVALVIALGAIALPASWLRRASRVPRIHDISTDTDRPPQFVAVVPLRAGARNPIEYGGPEIAAQQREGYPDIQPLVLPLTVTQAFDRAMTAVRSLGWALVASDPASGRIEATDTTFWFGFKDDVVIRVAAAPNGSRVDVRSVSRVGVSDVGTNAARIRKFLAALKEP
jgi:uncharacterized protein (DUF1499 family)